MLPTEICNPDLTKLLVFRFVINGLRNRKDCFKSFSLVAQNYGEIINRYFKKKLSLGKTKKLKTFARTQHYYESKIL